MDKESKMIGILPAIFTDNADLQTLFRAESAEFELLAGQINKARQDQFIATATAIGITRWETILNIQADTLIETLEDRRKRIQMRLLERYPFTYRTLKERLAVVLGDISFKITLNHNLYQLSIMLYRQKALPEFLNKQLNETLFRMVPANLEIIILLRLRWYYEMKPYSHRQLKFYTHREIRELVPIVTVSYRELKQQFTNRELSAYKNRKISRREITLMPLMAYEKLKEYKHRQMKHCTYIDISRRKIEAEEFMVYKELREYSHRNLALYTNRQISRKKIKKIRFTAYRELIEETHKSLSNRTHVKIARREKK